jgi:Gas vesicle synthesis protein GvpL/GvpF
VSPLTPLAPAARHARALPAPRELARPRVWPEPPRRPDASDAVVWVYAVSADQTASRLAEMFGVSGEPVRAVTATGLSAVVGTVGDAAGKPLASLLAGLAAIEIAGRAHHEVIAHLAEAGPVVPLRFATVYPDDATIRDLLAQRHAELTRMLESFGGKQEWDVKIYVELGPDGTGDDSSRYSPRWALAAERAERIAHALSGIAIKTRRRPASVPLAGEAPLLVFDGAYLLDTERAQEFASIVETGAAAHAALRAELNGPWPPYSFADR